MKVTSSSGDGTDCLADVFVEVLSTAFSLLTSLVFIVLSEAVAFFLRLRN
ncbi:hypothetical protein CWATWH0005_4156 [Crocosphaera watsonii WH 0005]|uniref:Uncharacterized protein n=1 Tax=Crocosphaera watsonii WH 0005 TaxID=423472 RepID=T2ITN0_CROWT|nr:hypothetical protein CWATWH0005_4156 [Crocosphaera watsonii WH 0005]